MLNFNKITKEEALKPEISLRDNVQVLKAMERHPDGKFKPGPSTIEKNRGSAAFQTAHDHLNDCANAAQAGDAEGAKFHLDMANQYANLGMHNHTMSGFLKTKKSDEVARPTGGYFQSGDLGGKDAGASKSGSAPQVQVSTTGHMHGIADRHEDEARMHESVGNQLGMMGIDKPAKAHKAIAQEHKLAAGHYRAAADAALNTSDGDRVATHLKAARASAASAGEMTQQMC